MTQCLFRGTPPIMAAPGYVLMFQDHSRALTVLTKAGWAHSACGPFALMTVRDRSYLNYMCLPVNLDSETSCSLHATW